MDPKHLFVDERLRGMCVYCGGHFDTRDHVPSKVLLDDPLPDNLPVVDACRGCNEGFSQDEEYLACLLESVIAGSCEPKGNQREKIRRIFDARPMIAARISQCCREQNGVLVWEPEFPRIRNVILKLARGHMAYELSLPQLDEPDVVTCTPLVSMNDGQRAAFESLATGELAAWPEIGSRAFMRVVVAGNTVFDDNGWIEVQQGRYRYRVEQAGTDNIVQMVLSEYLACRVIWT